MSKGEKHHNLHHHNCRNPGSHAPKEPKSTAGGGYPNRQGFNENLRLKEKKRHE